jgi:predicted phage terminase large subunit-like protein
VVKIVRALPSLSLNVLELEASVCRDDFYEFVRRFWHEVPGNGEPIWNWHIEIMCRELQEAAERVFRREPKKWDIVINVPPGTSKSTVCSVMFPAWVWTRMPQARTICASYSHILALDLSRKCRDIIQGDKWRSLFGEIELREDQNTKGYFLNQHGGFRFSVGTDGSVTGYHGDFIIVDDPINPKNALSEPERLTANRFISETLSQRKTNKAVTLTTLIMQRLHQEDPTALLLEKASRGSPIRHINLPAKIGPDNRKEVRPRLLVSRYHPSGLLDPVRLNQRVLDDAKVELGEFGYAGQMLQRPVPIGGGMFKVERLGIDTPPPLLQFKRLVRFWDKAATQDGGAWTAGVLMGLDSQGSYWILDVVRGQWDTARREAMIRLTAEKDGRVAEIGIEQEPGSGGKDSAIATLKNLAGFRVRIVRPTGDKVLRADPFSVQLNGSNVRVVQEAPWLPVYLNELQYFPFSTYKDQVDASSGAFNLLTRPRSKLGGLW